MSQHDCTSSERRRWIPRSPSGRIRQFKNVGDEADHLHSRSVPGLPERSIDREERSPQNGVGRVSELHEGPPSPDAKPPARPASPGLPPPTLPVLPPQPPAVATPPHPATFDELLPPGFGAPPGPPQAGALPPWQPTVQAPSPLPSADFSAAVREPVKGAGSKLVILACATIALVCAVVAGLLLVTGAGPSPQLIQSPAVANANVFASAVASGGFHYASVSSGTVGGIPQMVTQSGDAGNGEGIQFMTSVVGDNEVIVIGSKVYMKANATMLENMLGYSVGEAAPYADRWIAFSPSDSWYRTVAGGVTVGSIWGDSSESPTDQLPQHPESVSGLSTLSGMPVESVRYALHGADQAASASYAGTEVITFSANGSHLPSLLTEHLSGTTTHGPSTGTDRVTFTNWGEPVDVQPPSASIPFSTLPPPSSTV